MGEGNPEMNLQGTVSNRSGEKIPLGFAVSPFIKGGFTLYSSLAFEIPLRGLRGPDPASVLDWDDLSG